MIAADAPIRTPPTRTLRGVFEVEAVRFPTAILVAVTGEIDSSNADQFRTKIHSHGTTTPLHIDLAGVEFIDSHGLAVIVDEVRAGRDVQIVAASRVVRRLLDVLGLTHLLPLN